jgi:hypothetical protein
MMSGLYTQYHYIIKDRRRNPFDEYYAVDECAGYGEDVPPVFFFHDTTYAIIMVGVHSNNLRPCPFIKSSRPAESEYEQDQWDPFIGSHSFSFSPRRKRRVHIGTLWRNIV